MRVELEETREELELNDDDVIDNSASKGCLRSAFEKAKRKLKRDSVRYVSNGESPPWPELQSHIWSQWMFSWLSPMIDLAVAKHRQKQEEKEISTGTQETSAIGVSSTWSIHELFSLDPIDSVEKADQKFQMVWNAELQKKSHPSLLRVIFNAFGREWLLAGFLFFFAMNLSFVNGPILINLTLNYISDPSQQPIYGYIYAVSFFFASTIMTLCLNRYFHLNNRIGLKIRFALVCQLFRKTMKISTKVRQEAGVGKILNLMSNDIDKVQEATWQAHILWISLLQLFAAVGMLFYLVSFSAAASLITLGILSPLSTKISHKVSKIRFTVLSFSDARVKLMHEILKGMKVIKFYAYERYFSTQITSIRRNELKEIKKMAYLKEINTSIAQSTPTLMSISTFIMYGLLASFNPAVAFTVLSLFSSLRLAFRFLPTAINTLAEFKTSIKRMESLLAAEEIEEENLSQEDLPSDVAVRVRNGMFSWGDDQSTPGTLQEMNFEVKKGELIAIVGSVGSGKSTLLSSLLGETKRLEGSLSLCTKNISYMSQQPWIFQATLRDNILFGRPFDEKIYGSVISACALEPDLQLLPGGDMTEIGDRGINLSGGQKARVSMARALYRTDAEIYLLDDPLSAVDQHVQRTMFDSILKLNNKTRIMVTHQLNLLHNFDKIIVMEKGRMVGIGSFQELLAKGIDLTLYLPVKSSGEKKQQKQEEQEINVDSATKKKEGKLVDAEEHNTGSISARTYKEYFRSFGGPTYFVMLTLACILAQAARSCADWWLAFWSQEQEEVPGLRPLSYYLSIFVGISVASILLVVCRALLLVYGGLKASSEIHVKLLNSTMGAPLNFFHSNPVGRILNRFSRDMQTMDEQAPPTIHALLDALLTLGAVFIVICINSPPLLLAFPPAIYIYYQLQKRFRYTARELKRLDSITKSPMYQLFTEALNGLETIRAFKMERDLAKDIEKLLEQNSRAWFLNFCMNRWLALRLDMIGGVIVFLTALMCVVQKDSLGPGMAGFSLTYATLLAGVLNGLVRAVTDFEMRMNSVERLNHYINIPPEETKQVLMLLADKKSHWPSKCTIQFNHFEARYKVNQEPVLRDINCSIRSGEKIGIVGRTGAGKSSFVLALFRMLEVTNGSIEIAGVDISQMLLQELRSRLSIVPQDPVLFSGTVRSNLDVTGSFTDLEIWESLEHSQMKSAIEALPQKLDHEIIEGGENFSVGQRQLMCLARALLQKNQIILLDEATAAVDMESDNAIQTTIKRAFAECTVIIIAHRIHTIMDCDRIFVMDRGSLAEVGSPKELLDNKQSMFYSLVYSHEPPSK